MLFFILIPLMLAMYAFIFVHLITWLGAISDFFKKTPAKIVTGIILVIPYLIVFAAFFIEGGHIKRALALIGNYWFGIFLYAFGICLAAFIIGRIVKGIKHIPPKQPFSKKTVILTGIICICLLAAVSTYGILNAQNIRTTKYEANIEKDGNEFTDLKIAMVSDIHMGYNIGVEHVKNMVDALNDIDADIVIIAGDIFDNDYDSLEDAEKLAALFSEIKSKYGVYAVYGNHDIAEKIIGGFTFSTSDVKESDSRMDEFLKKAGIKLLKEEGLTIKDSVFIYGRADKKNPGKGITERKTPAEIAAEAKEGMPVICIDHEPTDLEEKSEAGIDIDLGGHTHDGQFFPLNISSRIIWENSAGHKIFGDMHSIVTSGVGAYGPFMRVGTKAEVCEIDIHFTGK